MNSNDMEIALSCYSKNDGDWNFNKTYPEGTPWTLVVSDFSRWLGAIYGYDLTEKVVIRDDY